MSIDFWCKKHGARTTQDGKCDVCNIKHRDYWSSDGGLPYIEECQSVLREKKHDAYISMKKSLHDKMCSHAYSGLIGVDFAKRSDNVKYAMMFKPETRAQRTINWFLYGKKYGSPPQHFNCRCEQIILEPKESFKR